MTTVIVCRRSHVVVRAAIARVWIAAAHPAFAQGSGAVPGAQIIDGPPAPIAPATVSRDAQGRATIRAIRLEQPLHVDGVIDDEVYARVPPVSDFVQQVPREGAAATERTEAWVMFDRDHLYIAARCWDTSRLFLGSAPRAALSRSTTDGGRTQLSVTPLPLR